MRKRIHKTIKGIAVFWGIGLLLVSGAVPVGADPKTGAGDLLDEPNVIVVLDPGHGGADAGVESNTGLEEKSLTLAISGKLGQVLKGRFRVVSTRTEDYHLNPFERVSKANGLKADLFISLHAAGSTSRSEKGANIYYFGEMGGRIYPREIAPESVSGMLHGEILWDFQNIRYRSSSERFAQLLQKRMMEGPGFSDCQILKAPLILLSGADMPAVLVEVGHLSHPEEGLLMNRPEVIDRIVEALSLAVTDFFKNSE